MNENKNNYNMYIIGGFLGAVIGLIAAILIDKISDLDNKDSQIIKKKLTKFGFGTISALWSLIEPSKGFKK